MTSSGADGWRGMESALTEAEERAELIAVARGRVMSLRGGEDSRAVTDRVLKNIREDWFDWTDVSDPSLIAVLVEALAEARDAQAATLEAICDVMRERSIATGPADTIQDAISALREGLGDRDATIGRFHDALTDIAALPEQGGCDDGVSAVELWMLMQRKAKEALP